MFIGLSIFYFSSSIDYFGTVSKYDIKLAINDDDIS